MTLIPAPLFAAPVRVNPCPPAGWTAESLATLKQNEFALPDADRRNALVLGMVDCLGYPDPTLRDGVAFEAIGVWLRKGDMSPESLRTLRDRLYAALDGSDASGFRSPFAALALSEVARTDRIAAWMTDQERAAMVDRAATYLESVRDYRGYNDLEGWRHGVAHGSDWLMQLALNPKLDAPQLARITDAVATQVLPSQPHAYVFGEPARLARPVLFAAQRELRDEAAWTTWFAMLTTRLADPKTPRDTAWYARQHDLMAFLQAVYVEADVSSDVRMKVVLPGVVAALKAMP